MHEPADTEPVALSMPRGSTDLPRPGALQHATDPASVYLAVLARSAASTLADVSEAMYVRRNLVRWMAMRRTLFLFARADIPVVQAAVRHTVAAMLRRQLDRPAEAQRDRTAN